MKGFCYLLTLCVAGVVGLPVHAMPIGVRIAMMGRASATFNEGRRNIGLAQVTVDRSDVTYCGTACEPAVQSVKWGDDTLVADTDFTIVYSDNVNAGTAKITLRGANLYYGTYTTNFTIRPRLLAQGMVGAIGNQPYTGAAQTPEPVVTDVARGVTLREDVEYTLSYADNTAVGEGIVTVTGKGNYTGAIARTFVIEPSEGSELEEIFGGAGKVASDGAGGWIMTLTGDVDSADVPIDIPDDFGRVTIDLNGHDLLGGDGKPALRIVSKSGDGAPTVLSVVTTGGDALVKGGDGGAGNPGGDGAPAIEVAEDAQDGVLVNVGAGVTVRGGDGGCSTAGRGGDGGAGIVGDVGTNDGKLVGGNGGASEDGNEGLPGVGVTGEVGTNNGTIGVPGVNVELTLKAGEYFKETLAELGYDVPTNGTPYSVTAKGLPVGLKLKYNAAKTKKVKKGKKVTTVVVKPAKCEWWIEGVPTAALDFFTNPPYLVITTNGVAETYDLPVEVRAQEVTELPDLELGQSMNTNGWLAGVGAGWTVSGLPKGLKYATKKVTKKSGKKTVTVAEAYAVYGKATKAGLFAITAKKKVGGFHETMKYRVLVRPKAPDAKVFGDIPTNITTMAYVPGVWDLVNGSEWDGGRGATALPGVGKVAKVTGLPAGLAFLGQVIDGTPTKPGTYVVTFTKNVKERVKGKTKTVAKTAQILWKVVANNAKVELGFNKVGGVIESGVVGLKYGDLLAFTATEDAKVTASGLPAGMALVDLGGGRWGFAGHAAKAGTYLVAVRAAVNGNAVTQRVALKVDGLPNWAKGAFNGIVSRTDCQPVPGGEENAQAARSTNGLATVAVSAAGKISGKFYEGGSNWTFSAACYTAATSAAAPAGGDSAGEAASYQAFACSNVVAKYAYKVTEKVKGKKKTVTKYVTRMFTLVVSDGELGGVATMTETGGPQLVATEIEAWQNPWGRADYKALGNRLFYTSKKVPYKTFTFKGTEEAMTLSLKVTPAGAVTATMSHDTGRTKKDPKTKKNVKVIYKATCSTAVLPATAADSNPFAGGAWVYFAPSAGNGFDGFVGWVPVP